MSEPLTKPHTPSLTIQHFPKTVEGEALINQQVPFVLQGQIWQGYRGVPVPAHDKQLSDGELEAIIDIDGSKHKVMERRRAHQIARRLAKQREMDERQQVRDDQDLRRLQLKKMREEMGEAAPEVATVAAVSAETPDTAGVASSIQCVICDKNSPPNHPSPTKWLRGHQMTCKKKHGLC